MKKNNILFIIFISLIFISCRGNSSNSDNTFNEKDNEDKTGKVIQMNSDLFKEKIVNFSDDNTEWNFIGEKPAVIDFYADWCAPCKKIAPYMEEFAKTYDEKIDVYKVDTQKEKSLAEMFGIRSIPAVLFIPLKGQPKMINGALPKESYEQIINEFLLNK